MLVQAERSDAKLIGDMTAMIPETSEVSLVNQSTSIRPTVLTANAQHPMPTIRGR